MVSGCFQIDLQYGLTFCFREDWEKVLQVGLEWIETSSTIDTTLWSTTDTDFTTELIEK